MKPLRSILAAGLALAVLSTPAWAITFPVAADTVGSTKTNLLSKSGGLATTLPVSKTSTAYIRFNVSQSGIITDPSAVTRARLVIYFQTVPKAENLTVFQAGSNGVGNGEFTETFTTKSEASPATGSNIAVNPTFAVGPASAKNFVIIDVTAEVQGWLTNAGTEFGFGISGDGASSTLIGSKEGTGNGYPPVLEVDVNDNAGGAVAGSTATFSDNVIVDNSVTDNGSLDGGITFGGPPEGLGHSGEGIASDRLGTSAHPNKFGLDFYSNAIQRMSITQSGNVGIGTTAPEQLLEVNGTAQFDDSITQILRGVHFSFISTNGSGAGNAQLNVGIGPSPNNFGIIDNTNGPLQFQSGGVYRMTILQNGLVGIGTFEPAKGLLEIEGNVSRTGSGSNVEIYTSGGPAQVADVTGAPVSLFASDDIVATSYIAVSDARIKNILGRSDSGKDLQTLRGIEVTDYHFKDVIGKGNRPQKKVIAQQVEKVYPQAVSLHTDVVPDIYQNTTIRDGWVSLATDLQVGDRVRLIGEKEEGIYEVLEVNETAFRTAFQPATDKVFVYGREVKDFRAVDYDAIAMLNVSATQELARKLEAKEAELNNLRAANTTLAEKLTALEARDAAREARLTRLENALDERPARAVTASLDLK